MKTITVKISADCSGIYLYDIMDILSRVNWLQNLKVKLVKPAKKTYCTCNEGIWVKKIAKNYNWIFCPFCGVKIKKG